jgi:serine protease
MKKLLILGLIILFFLPSMVLAENFKIKSFSDKPTFKGEVEYVPGEVLVKYKEGISLQKMVDLESTLGTLVLSDHRGGVKKLSVPAGKTEQELISILKQDPQVEYAELNTICHAFMTPNDPYYSPYQWNFPKVNCPSAWDISTGTGVVVGILDAGIAYEDYPVPSNETNTVQAGVTSYVRAPDLAGTAFTLGYDFINNDSHPNDNNGHGTHVAGTVAQTTNNSYGVAGMAFSCTLMPVKVLDHTGSGTAQTLADGLYWATDNGAQVINMSLGWPAGYNPGSTVQNAIIYAYDHGVVLVASSGNEGVSQVSYPAAYSQVIAVGATRYDDQLSYYSQYGSAQELVAPGGDLNVDQNGDGYGDGILQQSFEPYDPGPPVVLANPTSFSWWFYTGTSQAAPHVSALIAMMIANGQTGIENIRTILHETAVDLGSSGWDQTFGYGRIDAYAALTYGGGVQANFVGNPTSGCVPLTVSFTDQSTGDITSWSWTFGDGGTSTAQSPSHQYASAGNYTVSLSVTGPGGSDTETKTNYITARTVPVANFSGSPTSGYAPLTVVFTDQSSGSPTSWSWNFGDAGTSTSQNPSHQYTTAGTYTVTLTASNSCGSDLETKTNYITVSVSPGYCDDFNDGNISNWVNKSGTWTATGGYMKGNSNTSNARTTSPFGSFSAATIEADVRMNSGRSQRNSRILFAYVNSNNYRFIEGDDVNNRWRIYERVSGINYTRATFSRTISTAQWYHVKLDAAANGNVTLTVGGVALGSYKFSSAVSGLVGCGFNNANSDFDNFCVTAVSALSYADQTQELTAKTQGFIPEQYQLDQNYPNPFNLSTTISFSLSTPSEVDLTIYNIMGQKIKTIAQGWYEAGSHTVTWDGKNETGSVVASGIYFYKLNAGNIVITKKMSLLK